MDARWCEDLFVYLALKSQALEAVSESACDSTGLPSQGKSWGFDNSIVRGLTDQILKSYNTGDFRRHLNWGSADEFHGFLLPRKARDLCGCDVVISASGRNQVPCLGIERRAEISATTVGAYSLPSSTVTP